MQARKRVREFRTISFFVTLFLAVVIYALMMVYFARTIPPIFKWLLAPALAGLIVAGLLSYFIGDLLSRSCQGESSSFRLDDFITTAVFNGLFVLVIFIVWSVLLSYGKGKRLRVAAE